MPLKIPLSPPNWEPLFESVKRTLMRDWDPIGVGAQDEYTMTMRGKP